jgi:tripartite-type tricarboxylate transporter receptor subunit TctC
MGRVRHAFLLIAAITGVILALPGGAWADTYPSRRITFVVPFAPGGGLDTLARVLGEGMRPILGQPIIIENVPGADGTIGTGRVAQAAPDGYTFVIGAWNTHVTNAAIFSLAYDVVKDFEPVALLPDAPMVLITKKDVPVNNIAEFVVWLKTDADKRTLATAGIGSPPDLLGALLRQQTGTRFGLVPYRGGGPALQDVVAGQIDAMFINIAAAQPHIAAGTVRAVGVTSESRMPIAPEIPTMQEAGLQGLTFGYWAAIFAPKGTPPDIIGKINLAVAQALNDPAVKKRLESQGFEIPSPDRQSPAALAAYQKAEIEKWWPVIKAAGIKPH